MAYDCIYITLSIEATINKTSEHIIKRSIKRKKQKQNIQKHKKGKKKQQIEKKEKNKHQYNKIKNVCVKFIYKTIMELK